jgi:hypothetical protein
LIFGHFQNTFEFMILCKGISNTNWKTPVKQLLVMVFFLILPACSVTKGKENPKAPILKLLLSVSEGPCAAKCSQYSADFYSGQKLVYRGHYRMPVLGSWSYFIPPKLANDLLAEAHKLKLSELPDSLPSDNGEQRILLRFQLPNGKLKSVSAGNRSGPPAFQQFVKMLRKEVTEMVSDQEGEKIR